MLVTSKLSHTYPKKQIFIVFKYSVCGSSDCINHCYKRERNQYICKWDSGLKSYSWFYCYHAKRRCKLQRTYFLWVVFPLPLNKWSNVACQKMGAMKWGLALTIYRRSCSMLRCLEVELIWEAFLDFGNCIDCLNIYYGLHIMGETLWFLDLVICIVINTRFCLI